MSNILKGALVGIAAIAVIGGVNLNLGVQVPNWQTALNPNMITVENNIIGHTYNVNLGNELKDADSIQPVLTMLESAHFYDHVIIHVKGYGGDVDGLFALLNAIKLSHANILISVEGNSYSAYATLAADSGRKMIIGDHALLMFHLGSINALDCSIQPGMFDGIPASESCQNMKDALLKELTETINDNKLLTPEEKKTILSGGEVYLTSKQVNDRLKTLDTWF